MDRMDLHLRAAESTVVGFRLPDLFALALFWSRYRGHGAEVVRSGRFLLFVDLRSHESNVDVLSVVSIRPPLEEQLGSGLRAHAPGWLRMSTLAPWCRWPAVLPTCCGTGEWDGNATNLGLVGMDGGDPGCPGGDMPGSLAKPIRDDFAWMPRGVHGETVSMPFVTQRSFSIACSLSWPSRKRFVPSLGKPSDIDHGASRS
mmetsp:Transcript_5819/g.36105  ORF Transcript_5819/g.36105 Transcript_5819/m.36105 type:complete len:201 (+) Transcript_5819:2418-3020(+)